MMPPTTSASRGRPRTIPRRDTDAALRLRALRERLGLTPGQAAAYLGVPLATWRHWHDGMREPPAAVDRLLEVLGIVEALAPDIHARLLPEKQS
jgi:DNA-binding transcriptional regulator YiaG